MFKAYVNVPGRMSRPVLTPRGKVIEVIAGARDGKLKGWSFNMKKAVDEIEEKADDLPIRRVKSFEIDEVTLVMNRIPVYSATSIEVRAGGEEEVETRALYMPAFHSETEQIKIRDLFP